MRFLVQEPYDGTMKIQCSLLPIEIEDSPTLARLLDLIRQVSEQRRVGNDFYELRDLLLINQFSWPSFVEWDKKFSDMAFQPRLWARPSALEFTETAKKTFEYLHLISQPARHAFLEQPHPMPASRFVEKFGPEALGSLMKFGKVKVLQTAFEKLPFVPLEHLRGIQRRLSIRGGRSRVEASNKIASAADEQTVAALLLPEYKENLVHVRDELADPDKEWLSDRQMLVRLWMGTAQTFLNTARHLEFIQMHPVKPVIQPAQTECPVCRPITGKEVSPDGGPFPPFHPGCLCQISIDFADELKPTEAQSKLLRELGIKIIVINEDDEQS